MNRLGIEQLSVFGLPPVAYVNLAADLGCHYISGTLVSTPYNPPYYPPFSMRDDAPLRREMIAAMKDRGVSISLGEGFCVRQGSDFRTDSPRDIALMAELGVRRVNMVSFDPDISRTFDQFGALVEMAAAAGMESTVEFSKSDGKSVKTLQDALDAIKHVGRRDFRLLIDTMHLIRSGSTAADLAALDPDLIGYAQLCDAPVAQRFASYMEEAMYERMAPGDGELPLLDILAALPSHIVIGLEVPLRSEINAGVGQHARLGRCVEAARKLLAQVETKPIKKTQAAAN